MILTANVYFFNEIHRFSSKKVTQKRGEGISRYYRGVRREDGEMSDPFPSPLFVIFGEHQFTKLFYCIICKRMVGCVYFSQQKSHSHRPRLPPSVRQATAMQ